MHANNERVRKRGGGGTNQIVDLLSSKCVNDVRYDSQDDDKDQKRNHCCACSALFVRG